MLSKQSELTTVESNIRKIEQKIREIESEEGRKK